jgi:hypothetical protein
MRKRPAHDVSVVGSIVMPWGIYFAQLSTSNWKWLFSFAVKFGASLTQLFVQREDTA